MPRKQPSRRPGFDRTCAPGSSAISTNCVYCGESFVGPPQTVQQFEEQHRQVCNRAAAGAPRGG